jgi:O-antigen ligase
VLDTVDDVVGLGAWDPFPSPGRQVCEAPRVTDAFRWVGARRSPVGYLSVLLAGTVVMSTIFLILPPETSVTSQVVVVLVWAVVVSALWLACDAPVRVATGWLGGFLLSYLALWAYQVSLGAVRGELMPAVTLLVPFILLTIAAKPPSGAQAAVVADVIGWTVIGVAVMTLLLEWMGVVPSWDGLSAGTPNLAERSAYWLPLADVFDLNGRWVGPWVHPSLAGPWGAFLVVWGVRRRPTFAFAFLIVGFAILLLTASRTSLVAAITGLVVTWAFHRRDVRIILATVVAMAVLLTPRLVPLAAGGPSAGGEAAIAGDLAMSGRTGIWPTMVGLWRDSPWAGVGDAGFRNAIATGRLPEWAIQAHDVILDAGVRTGLLGFVLAGLIFALAAVGAVRAGRAGRSAGLALLATVFVTGLTDLTIRWTELYTGTVLLLIAVLLCASDSTSEPTAMRARVPSAAWPPPPRAPEPGSGPVLDRARTPADE